MHTLYMVKIAPIFDIGFFNHLLRLEYGTFRLFAGDESKKSGEMFLSGILHYFSGSWRVRIGLAAYFSEFVWVRVFVFVDRVFGLLSQQRNKPAKRGKAGF